MSVDLQEEERLFHAALAIESSRERDDFLRRSCGDNAALLERVQGLLEAHHRVTDGSEGGVTLDRFFAGHAPGLRIGHYATMREIGRGGFGLVFLARDTRTDEQVAIKVPRPELVFSESARLRFLSEAQTVSLLCHPNVTRVLEVGEAGGICFFAMEFCSGPSLDRFLAKQSLTTRQAAKLIALLADALHHVHLQGVLHRDLKPSNVLLKPCPEAEADLEGLNYQPQLTDFGLAKFVEHSLQETGSSVLLGTPLYMAPEQAECRSDEQGPWTDVYGLGAILYELLAGHTPFAGGGLLSVLHRVRAQEAPRLRVYNPSIPGELEAICLKCLRKAPADRYGTALELADDLRNYLAGAKVRARPPSLARRFQIWSQRPERIRDAGVWMIVLNLGMVTWLWGNAIVIASASPPNQVEDAHLLQSIAMPLLTNLPQGVLGWFTLKRWPLAMIGNLAASAVLLAMALSPFVWGTTPVFSSMYPNRLALWNVFWFLAILFATQTWLNAVALYAYRYGRSGD